MSEGERIIHKGKREECLTCGSNVTHIYITLCGLDVFTVSFTDAGDGKVTCEECLKLSEEETP